MSKKYLLTAFSPAMLGDECRNYDAQFDRIDADEARRFISRDITVAVYQKTLADHICDELSLPLGLPLSRTKVVLHPDDEALIASYSGPRFRDDCPLPAGTKLSYWRLSLFQGELLAA